MKSLDKLIQQLAISRPPNTDKLGLEAAQELHEELTSQPQFNPDDLLHYLKLFDPSGQRFLTLQWFDPRYNNRSTPQPAQKRLSSLPPANDAPPLQLALLSDVVVERPLALELTFESAGLSSSIIDALIGATQMQAHAEQRVLMMQANEAYRLYLTKHEQTGSAEDLFFAARSLTELGDAIATIVVQVEQLKTIQGIEYNIYERALSHCRDAKSISAAQDDSDLQLRLNQLGKGIERRMDLLESLRNADKKKGGDGGDEGAPPESGPVPTIGGVGSGVAAAPYQFGMYDHLSMSAMTLGALSFACMPPVIA